jgi:hypothetical protein
MNCVILQPSYIPWRGYFHQIYKADVFVFYDDVQYDKHGWRNRNRVKTPNGPQWLTIPVLTKGLLSNVTPINEIMMNPVQDWRQKHRTTLQQAYAKAPYYKMYAPLLDEIYAYGQDAQTGLLADFTIASTMGLARAIGIENTRFLRSSSLRADGAKTDRLLYILRSVGATHYISGPSARGYLEEDKLAAAGISLEYINYHYPIYEQLYPPFDPQVSILDLLFMKGPQSPDYIWQA